MRILLASLCAVIVGGCNSSSDPDAQQLARINKELAITSEKLDALAKRVDRLEKAATSPSAVASGESDAEPDDESSAPMTKTIVVRGSGAIDLDGEAIDLAQLGSVLRQAVSAADDPQRIQVVIRAEPSASHARVVEIVDQIRKSGIDKVAIGSPDSGTLSP